ncbi:hypothetical protein Salat_2612300 [Sesamum alatum]|uniref:S-RNase n=1 Tax=Sesamum alatum TaxID=300844 RepID=A0AAE2CAI8_9LAMI|nr:hypothetical protein Salat_2612300 [Sesamum alatum]
MNCDPKSYFIPFQDGRFVAKLDYKWPNLFEGFSETKQTFWENEWVKHGRCAYSPNLDQQKYFTMAIELKDRFDLLRILRASGINYGLVDPHKVNASISAATGYLPILKCLKNHLIEIMICFDSNGVNVINCPPQFPS